MTKAPEPRRFRGLLAHMGLNPVRAARLFAGQISYVCRGAASSTGPS
jgi:hypothetical protein